LPGAEGGFTSSPEKSGYRYKAEKAALFRLSNSKQKFFF
jgi:hypothetical protein